MPARAWGFESPLSHQHSDQSSSVDVRVGVARALRARRLPAVSRQPYANPHPTDLLGYGCALLLAASVLARYVRGGSSVPAGGRKPSTALSGLACARPATPSATATNRCPSTSASPPFRTNNLAHNLAAKAACWREAGVRTPSPALTRVAPPNELEFGHFPARGGGRGGASARGGPRVGNAGSTWANDKKGARDRSPRLLLVPNPSCYSMKRQIVVGSPVPLSTTEP